MLKDENIICISSIDWDFIWQGHQEVMCTLARNGNKVLFIENTGVRVPGIRDISRIKNRINNWFRGIKGIRKEADNLYIFSPLILPFPYSRLARWINLHLILPILDKWMRVMDFGDPIVWTFLPTPLSLDIADSFVKKLIVYYCIDNFSASSVSAQKIKRSEDELIEKADLVFVTSNALSTRCLQHSTQVYIFPFAVNFEEFEKAGLGDAPFPEELKNIKRPIVGYVGGVHRWIDQNLIKEVAMKCPDCSFVFVGPLQTNINLLSSLKNVYFLGKRDHKELPYFINNFDICIIPYVISSYTYNVYPTKLNEYLALGKPVISTSLPEVIAFNKKYNNIVYIIGKEMKFGECIEKAIAENSQILKNKRIEIARQNSWKNRIEKMSDLIEKEVERKRLDKETKWKENLAVFYRTARRRLVRLGAVWFLLYFLLFKTPFFWFLAEPLKIVESPKKADVIVAFGGGVGETGSPGKSTIERARYAAKLYQKGFAKNIIFSSGYTYIYNDAENMKLFAISMGVPEKDIVLEQRAKSTYGNVVFTKRILDEKRWKRVLLISSPYHMRRTSLIFGKWKDDLRVFYTPVENNQFYDRSSGINLEQMRAIIHEYLGIVYYWFKGYI